MKNLLLIVCSLIIPLGILAQSTTITGIVSGAEGQMIRLIAYDDFISQKIISLDKNEIAEDGSFELSFDLTETIMAFLDINYQRAEIFLEPGKSYTLDIKYDLDNQLASYYDRHGLLYDFTKPDSNELNQVIWQFNSMYNKFIMDNFDHIYKLHDKSRVSTFKLEVAEAFPSADSGYFEDYVTYKLADVEQFARLKGKNTLGTEYFVDNPVLYNNVEYTFFFKEFFEKFLVTSPDMITISDLIIAVNDNKDNKAILDAMGARPYLVDDNFRELVLLQSLKGLYYNGTYKKPQVLNMIRDISRTTSDPMHKKIAENLLETLTVLAPGYPAPDLQLTGIAGQAFKLKSIKGKPVLLTFFRSDQAGIKNDFDRLSQLFNVYNSGLEIISISMDNEPQAYIPLANSGSYNWTFAHYANDPAVYDLYNIRNLPLYVLIDVEGNIKLYPAPPPGDELEKAVLKVIH